MKTRLLGIVSHLDDDQNVQKIARASTYTNHRHDRRSTWSTF